MPAPANKHTRISPEVLTVLSTLKIDGNAVQIVDQLDRKLYTKVNEVLEALGGKWNRKAKAHLFETEEKGMVPAESTATTRIEEALLTGEIEKPHDFGYFPTPPELGRRLIELADLKPGQCVLEPSAGQGALADLIRPIVGLGKLITVELLDRNADVLRKNGYSPVVGNFLSFAEICPSRFDRIVMNPPFARQQDIDHVNAAFSLLKPGGKLVSVMAGGVKFRENKKTVAFVAAHHDNWHIEDNPPESFKLSGTCVNTVTVVLTK